MLASGEPTVIKSLAAYPRPQQLCRVDCETRAARSWVPFVASITCQSPLQLCGRFNRFHVFAIPATERL